MVDMSQLIGEVRRFGMVGPLYEVVGWSQSPAAFHVDARIRLIETGEETDYPIAALLADPLEA